MAAISLTPKTPWQLLIDEINSLNSETGANFTTTDLTWVIKTFDNTAGTASLTLSPAPGTPYFNNRDVNYHRLDLAKWFKNVSVRAYTTDDLTYGDVVNLVATRYGMVTADGDYFLDAATDFDATEMATEITFDTQGMQTITVTAVSGSLAWYGSLDITVYNTNYDLNVIITNTDLGALTYVDDGDGTKTAARLLTYPIDFSAYQSDLDALTVGGTVPGDLVDELIAVIVDATGITTELAIELKADMTAATVTTTGATADSTDEQVNPAFSNVVTVALTASANLYGTVLLGYNVA